MDTIEIALIIYSLAATGYIIYSRLKKSRDIPLSRPQAPKETLQDTTTSKTPIKPSWKEIEGVLHRPVRVSDEKEYYISINE